MAAAENRKSGIGKSWISISFIREGPWFHLIPSVLGLVHVLAHRRTGLSEEQQQPTEPRAVDSDQGLRQDR